jgi:hypothetical protein
MHTILVIRINNQYNKFYSNELGQLLISIGTNNRVQKNSLHVTW